MDFSFAITMKFVGLIYLIKYIQMSLFTDNHDQVNYSYYIAFLLAIRLRRVD